MTPNEKDVVETRDLHIENVSQDSAHDSTPSEVRGGDLSELPANYYWNWRFIGSLTAVVFMAQGLYLGTYISAWSNWRICWSSCVLGYVLPANTITIINADLGADPNYALIPVVKTLCGGVGLIMVGRLSDIFGRRWFMIGGGVLGIIGSLINATAKDINIILGGTVFIGIAGAVQVSFRYTSPNIHSS
jgi:MFS family permease